MENILILNALLPPVGYKLHKMHYKNEKTQNNSQL